MLAGLPSRLGGTEEWPDHLWRAVSDLYEIQQLDLEHHVLIAEKLVGCSPSLKQIRLAANSNGRVDLMDLSGIDTLRGMAAERAHAKAAFLTGEAI
jgi:hypothetical protein